MGRVERDAVNWANLLALGLVVVSDTFCTFARLYFVNFFAREYRLIGAFRLTNVAVNTVVSDN